MSVLGLGVILLVILVISILYEPRNFWNALFMLVVMAVLFLGTLIEAGP